MTIEVLVDDIDDATIMQRLKLKGPQELQLFKVLWLSGDTGVAEFPLKDTPYNARKYIYNLRQRFKKNNLEIISLGNGRYAFPRDTHEKIATILNYQ